MKKIFEITWLIFFAFMSEVSLAGGYCWNDKITQVIIQGDQRIFFTSEKSCLRWCDINPVWTESSKDRAYSMLLTAISSKKNIHIYWPDLPANTSTCEGIETHAIPSTFMLKNN